MNWDKLESLAFASFTYPMIALIGCCIVAIECLPIGLIVSGALASPVNWFIIGAGIFFGWLIYTGSILIMGTWKGGSK